MQSTGNKDYLIKNGLPALFTTLILILIGPLSFTLNGNKIISLGISAVFAIFLALYLILYFKASKNSSLSPFYTITLIYTLAVLFSDWPRRNYAILEGLDSPETSILFLISLSPIFALSFSKRTHNLISWLYILLPTYFSYLFFSSLNFKLLFSDDHPTFLFRLVTLKETFPYIPSYNPLWNAGIEFRDFFASGALSIYLLFFPLIQLFNPFQTYNIIIALLLFFFPILTSYFTCKFLGLNRGVFVLNSLLTLISTTLWYKWALSFGTLGFILSAQILPFLGAFIIKITDKRSAFSIVDILFSIAVISLMLLWPLSILYTLPLIIFCIIKIKSIVVNKPAVIICALILIINIPWMFKFAEVSKVDNFMQQTADTNNTEPPINEAIKSYKESKEEFSLAYYYKMLRQTVQTANPAVMILGAAGLFMLPGSGIISVTISLIIWLLVLATFGNSYKPQLELDRFLVTICYLLCLPASVAAIKLCTQTEDNKWLHIFSKSFVCFISLISILSLHRILSNKTLTNFYYKEEIVENLSQAIEKFGGQGRVLFSGFMLHELSNGHIAPLVYKTSKPLIARSYKHDHWSFFEVVPMRYLKKRKKRLEEFFDIYNVSAVITASQGWRDYLRSKEDLYKEEWHSERFRIFTRKNAVNDYFISGNGKVINQTPDSIRIILSTNDAIIKFNYIEGLRAEDCNISSEHIEGSINLIKLSDCPINKEIEIRL